MRRTGLIGLALLILAGVSGCGEIRDLWELRKTLRQRFDSAGVHVVVEGGRRTLTVSIEREDLLTLAPEDQAKLAYEVARFTHAHYARAARVDAYAVVLEQKKRTRFLFPLTWKISFDFVPSELDPA